MSYCKEGCGSERFPNTRCCEAGCSASEPRMRTCLCQTNIECLDRAYCGCFRPTGTAATGTYPRLCQCTEEEAWNQNVPPKPNCEWLANFSELRRRWSDHGRRENCKCCNCQPSKTVAPCHPCLRPPTCCSTIVALPSNFQKCCNSRLADGGYKPRSLIGRSSSKSGDRNEQSSERSSPCSSPCPFPNNCQPCVSSPCPVLKKRSYCQCTPTGCICQPTPRNCKCPSPVQIDTRANKEFMYNYCPLTLECACPPSERRFPRTRVKCPNARLCCPSPRLPPGCKYYYMRSQPYLSPTCNPCTSNKCDTITPVVVKRCSSISPCAPYSPCQFGYTLSTPCCSIPSCILCCEATPPHHTSNLQQTPVPSTRSLAHSSSPRGSSCSTPCRGSGV